MIGYNDNAKEYIVRTRRARRYLQQSEQRRQAQKDERRQKHTNLLATTTVWTAMTLAVSYLTVKGTTHAFEHWRLYK